MRITYLTAATLAVFMLPMSTPAFAGCSGASCNTSGAIVYGSGTYNSGNTSSSSNSASYSGSHSGTQVSSNYSGNYSDSSMPACPSGTTRSSDGFCMNNGYSGHNSSTSSAHSSGSIHTPLITRPYASRANLRFSSVTGHASSSYSTSSGSAYTQSTRQVVPFRTSVSSISNYRVAGMGANERLSPVTCPTNVYNPDGGNVLGCYVVVKPTPPPPPVCQPVCQPIFQQIRVVRPIIYVRYPVPVPVQMPCQVNTGCGANIPYPSCGNNWSNTSSCRRWY